MTISIGCDDCGRLLRAKDAYAGKLVRCPHCRAVVRLPGGRPVTPAGRRDPAAPPEPGDPLHFSDFKKSVLLAFVTLFLAIPVGFLGVFILLDPDAKGPGSVLQGAVVAGGCLSPALLPPAVFVLMLMGLKGRRKGYDVLTTLMLAVLGFLTLGGVTKALAVAGVWPNAVAVVAAVCGGVVGGVAGALWAGLDPTERDDVKAFAWGKTVAAAAAVVGLLPGAVCGYLAATTQKEAPAPDDFVRGIGLFALLGAVALGAVGGYLGFLAGVLRDVLHSLNRGPGVTTGKAPSRHVLDLFAEKVLLLLYRRW